MSFLPLFSLGSMVPRKEGKHKGKTFIRSFPDCDCKKLLPSFPRSEDPQKIQYIHKRAMFTKGGGI